MEIGQEVIDELFIVGNGFDLQCGLETTYENFLKYTFFKLNEERQDIEEYLGFDLDKFSASVSESISCSNLYEENWRGISPLNFYSKENYYPNLNVWYHIFLYEKLLKNVNWSSVESMLASYLKDYSMIDYIASIILKNKERFQHTKDTSDIPLPKTEREDILAKIGYILVKKDVTKLTISNPKPYTLLSEIYNSPEQCDIETVRELVTQILVGELNALEYDFQLFLSHQKNNKNQYREKVNHLLKRMLDPHKDFYEIEPKQYYLLSFNYSSLWSEGFKPKFSPYKFLDVHGKLSKKSSLPYSTIIFGVDASLFEATSLEYRFTKTYRTLKNYSAGFEGAGEGREIYSPTIKTIKFYGHSLAEADYAYFQQLFDYYNLYQNNDLKLVFYYSIFDADKKEEIEQEQIYSVSRLIEKYGQTLDNKDHGKNLLTRLIQTNRLQLIEL